MTTTSIVPKINEPASSDAYALMLLVDNGDGLPMFKGETYDDHVNAWHTLEASARRHLWSLAAIAVSLDKKCGARTDVTGAPTDIQRFCRDVNITPTHFSYLAATYRTFALQPRNTGIAALVGSPELHFKHFLVATRFTADPDAAVAAVVEAHDRGISANKLAEELQKRQGQRLRPTSAPTEEAPVDWRARMATDASLRDFVHAEIARATIELDTAKYNADHWHRIALRLQEQLDALKVPGSPGTPPAPADIDALDFSAEDQP